MKQSAPVLDLTEIQKAVALDFEKLMTRYGIAYAIQFIDDDAFYFEVPKEVSEYIFPKIAVGSMHMKMLSVRCEHAFVFQNNSKIIQSSLNPRLFLVMSSMGTLPIVPSPLTLFDAKAQDVDKEQANIEYAYAKAIGRVEFVHAITELGYRDSNYNTVHWRNHDGETNRMGSYLFMKKGGITVVIDVSTGDFDIASQL